LPFPVIEPKSIEKLTTFAPTCPKEKKFDAARPITSATAKNINPKRFIIIIASK
jgi:hypothetical protein